MTWDFSKFENDIEQQEANVEEIEQEKEHLEEKNSVLKESIQSIANDAKLVLQLAQNEQRNEQKIQENLHRIEAEQTKIYSIQEELEQQLEEIHEERNVLESLKAIGEDVSEAESILDDRENILYEANVRLKDLADRLGMSMAELEAQIVSPVEQAMENESQKQMSAENMETSESQSSMGNTVFDTMDRDSKLQLMNRVATQRIESDPNLSPEQKRAMLAALARNDSVADSKDTISASGQIANVPKSIFASGANDRMPDSTNETITDKAARYVKAIDSIDKSLAMYNDPVGQRITAALMLSEAEQLQKEYEEQLPGIVSEKNKEAQVLFEQMKTSTSEGEYYELAKKRQAIQDEIKAAQSQAKTLEENKMFLKRLMGDNKDTYTITTVNGKGIFDAYQGVITQQGKAYPDKVINDCGVCSMVNLANQQGAAFTEKSGLALGYGNYAHGNTAADSGWTNLQGQKNILSALGYEGQMKVSGLTFEDLTDKISQGHGVSLNVFSDDLCSGDTIKRNSKLSFFGVKMTPTDANHAVTVAAVVKDKAGNCTGILINDTGGGAGKNNPIIYISKSKYEQMRSNTAGFSSIICTGRRV